jgi:hypothetical protein
MTLQSAPPTVRPGPPTGRARPMAPPTTLDELRGLAIMPGNLPRIYIATRLGDDPRPGDPAVIDAAGSPWWMRATLVVVLSGVISVLMLARIPL